MNKDDRVEKDYAEREQRGRNMRRVNQDVVQRVQRRVRRPNLNP